MTQLQDLDADIASKTLEIATLNEAIESKQNELNEQTRLSEEAYEHELEVHFIFWLTLNSLLILMR